MSARRGDEEISPPLLLRRRRRRRHTCTYTQWLVCARLDLQGKALACMAAPIFLSAIENASRAHLREREPGPEQQKTASHLKHAPSSRQRSLSVKMHLGGCSLQTLACLSTSFSWCTHLYRSVATSALFKTKCFL